MATKVKRQRKSLIAIVGCGTIGRGWAISFLRAGYPVTLYDVDQKQSRHAADEITETLKQFLGKRAAKEACITIADSMDMAVGRSAWIQECIAEDLDAKRAMFSKLDLAAPSRAIIASSTSALMPSQFLSHVAGRRRCLVAHPFNPPHIIPLVEIVPTKWLDPSVLKRGIRTLTSIGQQPVIIMREISGFVGNRLQAALVNEAMALVANGIISPQDLDKCMSSGLGLRWAFLGPFETMDLNASDGFLGYAARYSESYYKVGTDLQTQSRWTKEAIQQVEAWRRTALPVESIRNKQIARDNKILAIRRIQDN